MRGAGQGSGQGEALALLPKNWDCVCVFGGSGSCLHVCGYMCNNGQLFSCVQIVCWSHLAGDTCALVPHTCMCLFVYVGRPTEGCVRVCVCVCVCPCVWLSMCGACDSYAFVCLCTCVCSSRMTVWIHMCLSQHVCG